MTAGDRTPLTSQLRKILVANRGDAAVRVIRACRELGIASAAVYSDADRQAPYLALADEAVHIGASPAAESYLNQPRILDAALETGADAVHPGFGFLAENATFVDEVRRAGLVFVGPGADAVRLMGSKASARRLAAGLGIPVLPGYDGDEQSPGWLADAAAEVGYPLLIKAAAGGGGTGIRVVRHADELAAQMDSARREAEAAFGDQRLILERLLENARHIEVQVVGDRYGKVLHCFDRECSVQRRRQKVIEEAPVANLSPGVRADIASAAVRIATAVRYESLGTVEFLVDDATGRFYFLEMNTRLQVEHGITEMVAGLDLVAWQIRIAEGAPLTLEQSDITVRGHAIQCRLYAEAPELNFAPAAGRILHFSAAEGPHVRVDTGVRSGAEVSAYYDPMIAKLMTWAEDRPRAIRAMRQIVRRTRVLGLPTNQRFLERVLCRSEFESGRVGTSFVDANRDDLAQPSDAAACLHAGVAAAVHRWRLQAKGAGHSPRERTYRALADGHPFMLAVRRQSDDRVTVTVDGRSIDVRVQAGLEPEELLLEIDGHLLPHAVVSRGNETHVAIPGAGSLRVEFVSRFEKQSAADMSGCYRAPMTGRVIEVSVQAGATVRAGERMVTIESMKMEHVTVAAADGLVRRIHTEVGAVVAQGVVLVEIDAAQSPATHAPLEEAGRRD